MLASAIMKSPWLKMAKKCSRRLGSNGLTSS